MFIFCKSLEWSIKNSIFFLLALLEIIICCANLQVQTSVLQFLFFFKEKLILVLALVFALIKPWVLFQRFIKIWFHRLPKRIGAQSSLKQGLVSSTWLVIICNVSFFQLVFITKVKNCVLIVMYNQFKLIASQKPRLDYC